MKNILIHIGYYKTASTWLQADFFNDESDIFFPLKRQYNGDNAHYKRYSKSTNYLGEYFIYDKQGNAMSPFENNTQEIHKEIHKIKLKNKNYSPKKVPVISHERLCGSFESGYDTKTIADRINHCFPKGKILIVIREQKSMILSHYLQHLWVGGRVSINQYLCNYCYKNRFVFSYGMFKYSKIIEYYQSLFKPENTLVLPYEMLVNDSNTFFKLLGDFVGKKIDLSHVKLDKKRNSSKKERLVLSKFRFINTFYYERCLINHRISHFPGYHKVRKVLTRVLSSFINTNNQLESLKKQISFFVGKRYVEDNKKVSKMINIDLSKYKYY